MVGKLVLNGPTPVDHDILDVSVYAAELEAALAMACLPLVAGGCTKPSTTPTAGPRT